MISKIGPGILVLAFVVGCASGGKWPEGFEPFARASLSPKSGASASGSVIFAKSKDALLVRVAAAKVSKGPHGFHIHEKGDCSSADAKSAGDHYNPGKHKHGGPATKERHVGDLGNVTADEKESVQVDLTMAGMTDAESLIGRSVVLHDKADDLKSQPAGDAGKRIACGVIEKL